MRSKTLISILLSLFLIIIIIILLFYLIRLMLPRQIDDISPEISCEKELLEKARVFYVIPRFNNKNISDNKEWCNYILSLNKTLRIHGIYHTYNEFSIDRNADYLDEGIENFEKCFGFKPNHFKPSQLKISENNIGLIKTRMKLDLKLNQFFNKVYHCNDTGKYKNSFIDKF